MTPANETLPAERVTVDDIRHRLDSVKSLAVEEAKAAADTVLGDNTRTLVMVAGLVVIAASLAFFLGAKSGSGVAVDRMLGE